LVILPTFNEAASLPELLALLRGLPTPPDVLVVDDASHDGTDGIVRTQPDFGQRVFLLARPAKLGLGSAYRDGFSWALARDYAAVIEMDADLSHDPRDVPRLLATIAAGADLAVGSRYLRGISVVHWPLRRLVLSLGAGLYARWIAGVRLTDPTSGFKAIRRSALERILPCGLNADGYGFQIALHFWAQQCGLRLDEVPIVFTERRDGQSKLSGPIAREAAWLVLKLACRRGRGARR
jgi:dolichol-phosphate mannosyltransferase